MSMYRSGSRPQLWFATRRIGALSVLIGAAIVASAILQGEVPEAVSCARGWIRPLLQRHSYMTYMTKMSPGTGSGMPDSSIFISRRFGRRLAHSRFAHVVHLSPERLELAEKWFERYGVLAIIFGRHIPGFRVPITLAAGVFRVRYPVFAASVALSTAIWAGVFLIVGINFGGRLEAFLRVHREASWLFVAFIVVVVSLSLFQRRRRATTVSLEKP